MIKSVFFYQEMHPNKFREDQGVMVIKEYATFLKALKLEPDHQIVYVPYPRYGYV